MWKSAQSTKRTVSRVPSPHTVLLLLWSGGAFHCDDLLSVIAAPTVATRPSNGCAPRGLPAR
jgi:hypothetical protein